MKKIWILAGVILVIAVTGLATIWPKAKEIYVMKKHEREIINLETEIVRIDLAGHHFNVPLRYMYSEAIEKRKGWPTVKKERVKVDYLNLSVLLPDLRPYYPEDDDKWKVRGHGDRVQVSITVKNNIKSIDWFQSFSKRILDNVATGKYKLIGEIHGLIHVDENAWQTYIPADGNNLKISCYSADNAPSPSCRILSFYKPSIVIDYYYSLDYLSHWREIDGGLKRIFDGFAQAAQSEQSTKEE